MSLRGRDNSIVRNGKRLVGKYTPAGGHHASDREKWSEGDEPEELGCQTLEGERVEQMGKVACEEGRVLRQQDGGEFSC